MNSTPIFSNEITQENWYHLGIIFGIIIGITNEKSKKFETTKAELNAKNCKKAYFLTCFLHLNETAPLFFNSVYPLLYVSDKVIPAATRNL